MCVCVTFVTLSFIISSVSSGFALLTVALVPEHRTSTFPKNAHNSISTYPSFTSLPAYRTFPWCQLKISFQGRLILLRCLWQVSTIGTIHSRIIYKASQLYLSLAVWISDFEDLVEVLSTPSFHASSHKCSSSFLPELGAWFSSRGGLVHRVIIL